MSREKITEIKGRKSQLFADQMNKIRQRQTYIAERNKKEQESKKKMVEDNYLKYGLWDTAHKIDQQLQKRTTTKDQLIALKEQINIYEQLFQFTKKDKHLLQFSSHGKHLI
ncbi:hypothetical protein SNE40_005915 [Patella caerulea]|uniref:Uncharacterized protein n=1 Tax=Patella caerulea TaxID=87958 RepID=A0AAN8Q3W2_PATCE